MPRYLLDTNACIAIRDLLAGTGPRDAARQQRIERLRERWQAVPATDLAMSLTTLGELAFGAAKSASPQATPRLAALRSAVTVLCPGEAVAHHYGQLRSTLEAAGTPIGANDNWIAAHALAEDCTLITNNTREFERVPGLRVQDWSA